MNDQGSYVIKQNDIFRIVIEKPKIIDFMAIFIMVSRRFSRFHDDMSTIILTTESQK